MTSEPPSGFDPDELMSMKYSAAASRWAIYLLYFMFSRIQYLVVTFMDNKKSK